MVALYLFLLRAHLLDEDRQDWSTEVDPDSIKLYSAAPCRVRESAISGRIPVLAQDQDLGTFQSSSLDIWKAI
ncbi:unnamed protein product [Cylindrotheca closterium]|uniref:Uncharacterized protein n=1 Tax=Cylindrotheca closterium TaxID=2856 RepID=A0AAD2FXP0_9STRA|nr:unnamed protein product [Cylindrotheca closterium]